VKPSSTGTTIPITNFIQGLTAIIMYLMKQGSRKVHIGRMISNATRVKLLIQHTHFGILYEETRYTSQRSGFRVLQPLTLLSNLKGINF